MPRRDTFHIPVRHALEKDGWIITHDPYTMQYLRDPLQIDIGEEAAIGAEKGGQRIAVEVKSFSGKFGITDLYTAVGQFLVYRTVLAHREPQRTLYLAMPTDAYDDLLISPEGQDIIAQNRLKLALYDAEEETIE